jgi:transcriptional regulator with XRE-family HTH domain
MNDVPNTFAVIGARVRNAREQLGIKSLEKFADRIGEKGGERPSTAKLSRIETGVQPVPLDILEPLSELTKIPARDLRPDLAKLLEEKTEAA